MHTRFQATRVGRWVNGVEAGKTWDVAAWASALADVVALNHLPKRLLKLQRPVQPLELLWKMFLTI